jgi:hypothetical protein
VLWCTQFRSQASARLNPLFQGVVNGGDGGVNCSDKDPQRGIFMLFVLSVLINALWTGYTRGRFGWAIFLGGDCFVTPRDVAGLLPTIAGHSVIEAFRIRQNYTS